MIPTWATMEEGFLREQETYRHSSEFLKNVAGNEIGRIDQIPWNPIPNDQNGTNLGALMDEDENGEVFLVNIIQLEGMAWKLEPGYNLFARSRPGQKMSVSKNPYGSSSKRSHRANNPNNCQHQRHSKRI